MIRVLRTALRTGFRRLLVGNITGTANPPRVTGVGTSAGTGPHVGHLYSVFRRVEFGFLSDWKSLGCDVGKISAWPRQDSEKPDLHRESCGKIQ